MKPQPIDNVRWMHREDLQPNDYNPNKQPPPEHALLKVSLLEDGWTAPIVAYREGDALLIVDGEHRWRASADPAIYAMTDGMVPVVVIEGTRTDRQMSTIRHNRARGEHYVLSMAEIVREMIEAGTAPEEIMRRLGMESEEVERLADAAGLPVQVGRATKEFSAGWVPSKS